MIRGIRKKLKDAIAARILVRLRRPVDPGYGVGYVLDVGPTFFLMAVVNGDVRYDGFSALRADDVGDLRVPDPQMKFVETAFRLRGETKPKKPSVRVTSLQHLLLSASRAFPLVVIHRELADPDACQIGEVVRVTRQKLILKEITPDAEWEDKLGEYRTSEITRVDFGGFYEEALHLVAQSRR
jgi:hypothetical protein